MPSDYETYLEERFQGEVYGEAVFRGMAEHSDDPDRVRKLRVLEKLERETKERLLLALREAGGVAQENAERAEEGEALGAQMAKAPWLDLMRGFRVQLAPLIEEFERAEALAPAGGEDLLQHVTAHERALLAFADGEVAGNDSTANLEPVVALLWSDADLRRLGESASAGRHRLPPGGGSVASE